MGNFIPAKRYHSNNLTPNFDYPRCQIKPIRGQVKESGHGFTLLGKVLTVRKKMSPFGEEEDEAVVAGVLAVGRLAQPRAALEGVPRQRVEVTLEGELGVEQHVDAAPGAAHPGGAPEDLDVVELAEDARQRARRHCRPVTRRVARPAPVSAAARGRHRSLAGADVAGVGGEVVVIGDCGGAAGSREHLYLYLGCFTTHVQYREYPIIH
jgi:hypothetical protein